MATKICVVIRSFHHPNLLWGLPPSTRGIALPESRVLYTVLRSPHIDKKSREQFEMEIKKQYLVIKTQPHELQKTFFWLKRQRKTAGIALKQDPCIDPSLNQNQRSAPLDASD
ncbi:hypothetical protein ACE6H2_015786 [Prunus campanulata]